jgi:Pyridoxamine 5'-phosphate oxidase
MTAPPDPPAVTPTAAADENRRPLDRTECEALLARPLVGVFSTVAAAGWIHSVPFFYSYVAGECRILAESRAAKARNAARTGQATLCVQTVDGTVRSYVSLSGAVSQLTPPPMADLAALDERYSRTDFAAGRDDVALADAVLLILRPTRWIAWTDWD